MRLVTYDRGGARRLGAWVGEAVVDLPDAVGHPAFPTTMEALVARSGGSLLDAARDALQRPEYWEPCLVPAPRLLVPILPSSDRNAEPAIGRPADHPDAALRAGSEESSIVPWLLGPQDRVPWPAAGTLDYELELACIVGRGGRDVPPREAPAHIFGYTLVVGWLRVEARGSNGHRPIRPTEPPPSRDAGPRFAGATLGPCVVTGDEFDPATSVLTFSVNGRVRSRGGFRAARWSFPDLVVHLSRTITLSAGHLIGSGTFPGGRGADVGVRLEPGTVVGAGAAGIGTFVVSLGSPSDTAPSKPSRASAPIASADLPSFRLLRTALDPSQRVGRARR